MRNVEVTCVQPGQAWGARERRVRRDARDGLPMEVLGIVYFLLIVFAGGVLVWQPARIAEMNERIAELDSALQGLKMQSEALRKTVSGIESLEYVEREARTRLGMVSPEEVKTLSLSEPSREAMRVASLPGEEPESRGIMSLFGRIAQIFGVKEATAKGR